MNEKLKDAQKKLVDFWNKYNRKQKTMMVSIALALVVFVVVLAVVLNKTDYVILVECESATQASDVRNELRSAGISYTISDNWVVKVAKEDKVNAQIAIATSGVISKEFTLEEALDGSLSTTEADKLKRYKAYKEDRLRIALESLDYVKAAKVTINIPENNWSVLDKEKEASAAVMLNLKKEIDSTTSARKPEWIKENMDNPFRDWDDSDYISPSSAKKAIIQYKKTRNELLALNVQNDPEAQTKAIAAVEEYTKTFNRMRCIETDERDLVYEVLCSIIDCPNNHLNSFFSPFF